MADAGIPPERVADGIVKAAISDSPSMRIVIGEDTKTMSGAKKRMADEDFEKMIAARFFGNS